MNEFTQPTPDQTADRSPAPTMQAPPAAPADGVVAFASVDWWYHNRGHSECQIMRRLAARVPVIWVNSIGMRAPVPGKTELPFRRYVRKLKSTLKGLRQDECGMWVLSPLFVPRYTPRMVHFNGRLLDMQVRRVVRKLGLRNPATWVTIPTAAPAVISHKWARTLFNRSDIFSSFPEVDASLIEPLEQSLLTHCDEVLYVNRELLALEQGVTRSSHYIDHGVDYAHFSTPAGERPTELAGLDDEIVGFYGALDDYTIDLDLMIAAARHIAPRLLVVIGPRAMEIERLLCEPNVRYLGPVPYEDLPRYAAHFKVGIMPWLQNDWIRKCNPIKLKEYLALGFPTVSMSFPELDRYGELVYSAKTHTEFLAGLDRALAEDDAELVMRRRASVAEASWDALSERVANMMGLES